MSLLHREWPALNSFGAMKAEVSWVENDERPSIQSMNAELVCMCIEMYPEACNTSVCVHGCHCARHNTNIARTALCIESCDKTCFAIECAGLGRSALGLLDTGQQKQYVTGDSQEITQPSTNPAQTGLSCEF